MNPQKEPDKEKGDELLKRMLKTPPKPKRTYANISYVILDGRFLVADIREHDCNSITADLYKNLSDFHKGSVMERGVNLAV